MSDLRPAGVYGRQSRGKTKSVDEQVAECVADVEHQCKEFRIVATYTDLVSASRYGTKRRGDHVKLLADITSGRLKLIATWSPDRADRTLTTWSQFLDACRDHKVLIRITDHERTYDVTNPRDWRQLAEDGIDAAYFSEKLSRVILRGVGGAAKSGRPPMGPCPYGYRRLYDPTTGKLQGEYVDDEDGSKRWVGGQEIDPDTAPIVREIFARVARGEPTDRIIKDLDRRRVPPPGTRSHKKTGSKQWYPQRIRDIVLSPTYLGRRRHRATGRNATDAPQIFIASWPALVDESVWYAANRVMNAPSRFFNGRRPGRQTHLLTYLAVCHRGHPIRARSDVYTCTPHGCVHLKREPVDRLVRAEIIKYLSRDDVYANLRRAGDDAGREAVAAEDEAARLQGELDDWRRSATDGRGTTPETLAVVEADLRKKIQAAQDRAKMADLPPALRQMLAAGGTVAERWDNAELAARRDLIRAFLVVTLYPSGRNHTIPIKDRVKITPVSSS